MLAAVESFAPRVLRYDGRVETAPVPARPSPTHLETLGGCPLQYFFKKILRIREPDPQVIPDHVEARDLGSETHRLLETLYRRLADEGAFDTDPEACLRRVDALLDELWPDHVTAVSGRRVSRLPLLWTIEQERWRAALRSFVENDLHALAESGWKPVAFEKAQRRRLDLGDGVHLEVRGRFDRVLARDAALRVGDYKTGRSDLEDHVNVTKILRAEHLQVPLYQLLA